MGATVLAIGAAPYQLLAFQPVDQSAQRGAGLGIFEAALMMEAVAASGAGLSGASHSRA
ncbi:MULTISPECIES: hypothetical protein [unclassified Achromobacter]|uniref:hypothetical protein n=1 Tax=unclassified Achromobacter TaxID=2626865 RepID=UPI001303CBFE|nr:MULTISPECIES: hypothetical protein [unclassified Achromobacter]